MKINSFGEFYDSLCLFLVLETFLLHFLCDKIINISKIRYIVYMYKILTLTFLNI